MKISVLTPSWNRAAYLERVWQGLNNQTYRNFEWIVSNDGSTDDTQDVVHKLAAKSDFSIVLINASEHIGKARMDNEAVSRSSGKFILWNDSDDYLLPNSIELLVKCWNSIPGSDQDEFIGVTALCATKDGAILTGLPNQGIIDSTWNELTQRHKLNGDMLYFVRASALKACPFPEVDFVIPEGCVWTTLGDKKIRYMPTALKIVEYRTPNCISFSNFMEFSRGRAFAMAISEHNLRVHSRTWMTRLWKLITFIRYCFHGEISLKEQVHMWGGNTPLFLWIMMLPVAWLLALKDNFQGKVRRTHRDFQIANQKVIINHQFLGSVGNATIV